MIPLFNMPKSTSRPHPPKYKEKSNNDEHYAIIIKYLGDHNTLVKIDYTKPGSDKIITKKEILPLAGRLRSRKAKQKCIPGKYCLVEPGRIIYVYNSSKGKDINNLYPSHFRPKIVNDEAYEFSHDRECTRSNDDNDKFKFDDIEVGEESADFDFDNI